MQNYETFLNKFRQEIDDIDSKLLALLEERINIIKKVRKIKQENNEKFFIKSAREADMIKNLVKKSSDSLPKSMIINIWRKIITASNMLEQSLRIAIHNPNKISDYNYLLREYYADFVPFVTHDSVNNIVLEIEKNTAQIAIFALPSYDDDNNFSHNDDIGEDWWINLANNKAGLKVFAKIPFATYCNNEKQPWRPIELVAMAIKKLEKSSQDFTLFCIETNQMAGKADILSALNSCKISAKILKTTKLKQVEDVLFHLIEANGFFDENSDEIKKFKQSKIKPFVKILGVYPKQFID